MSLKIKMPCFYLLAFSLYLDFQMFTTRSIMEIICLLYRWKVWCTPWENWDAHKDLGTEIWWQQALGKYSLNITSLFLNDVSDYKNMEISDLGVKYKRKKEENKKSPIILPPRDNYSYVLMSCFLLCSTESAPGDFKIELLRKFTNKQHKKRTYFFSTSHIRAFNMLRCTVSLQEKEIMCRFLDSVVNRGSRRRVRNLKWFEMQVGST